MTIGHLQNYELLNRSSHCSHLFHTKELAKDGENVAMYLFNKRSPQTLKATMSVIK